MADSPLEGMTPEELSSARKKELASDLRALVKSPGWQYVCYVLEQQRLHLLLGLKSTGSPEELMAINLDLREAETYTYLQNLPQTVINEFDSEASDAD